MLGETFLKSYYVYITIFLKVCSTTFSMLCMNKLCNHYYINDLPRVFYLKDAMKASQSS